jgi:hypothetical protein
MRGLVPRIHVCERSRKAWMAGTSQDKPGHDGPLTRSGRNMA